MKFHQKNNFNKVVLVISDLHLGAGLTVFNRRNFLEDFFYDDELIDFINYYAREEYVDIEVELIINGDFLDLLSVPFVKYFDDEFFSEVASLAKLKMIFSAHQEVFDALLSFIKTPKRKLVYIVGNHDAEIILPNLRQFICRFFEERENFSLLALNAGEEYRPHPEIVIKHGHEYELAHNFDVEKSIISDKDGNRYFMPPWGSYYVVRVVNRFKEGREFINAIRPINKFIINGIIYDTLYTIRFLFANFYYFLMVRVAMIFKQKKKIWDVLLLAKKEIELFQNFEQFTEDYLSNNEDVKVLIMGHTHDPMIYESENGSYFINTGTWTKMYNLDFGKDFQGARLTFAEVGISDNPQLNVKLNEWVGKNDFPFKEFR